MKRSPPPKRRSYLKRSSKPIAKRGKFGQKRRERYAAFLRSGKWKQLRREAIKRTHGLCERCGRTSVGYRDGEFALTLHVHHKRYTRPLGEELPEDLEVLCDRCHRAHHASTDRRFKGRIP